MKCVKYISTILLAIMLMPSYAQMRVKVLTRIIEKQYYFPNEFLLEIDAEKADIFIETAQTDSVSIELRQIVKNPNQKTAEAHMKAQNFTEDKSKERLFLRNYILFDNQNQKISSVFKNEYRIKIPAKGHVKIKNQLGNIKIKNTKKSLALQVEYGKVELNNCMGKMNANITLGELTINGGTLLSNINTQNTQVKLHSPGGEINGECSFGSFSLILLGEPFITDMKTSFCETTILNKSDGTYNFYLESTGGQINAPMHQVNQTGNKQVLKVEHEKEGVMPFIKFKASDNDINLY